MVENSHEQSKISPKQAVDAAVRYYRDITGIATPSISVEEVEFNEGKNVWAVTLGIQKPSPYDPIVSTEKEYKIFEVDAVTTEVLSMKIRDIK